MACDPILRITDGTTTIDLLAPTSGILLEDWIPSTPPIKNEGTFIDNPLIEGRRLSSKVISDPIDTFNVKLHGFTQDEVIRFSQEVRRLLQAATDYWTNGWLDAPVWLEARGSEETNTRYAVIADWRMQTDDNPYATPFFGATPVMDGIVLAIEHLPWQSTVPGTSDCVPINNQLTVQSALTKSGLPTASTDDASVDITAATINTANTLGFIGNIVADVSGGGIRFRAVAVPQGATILSAYIRLVATSTISSTTANGQIKGELAASPAAFSTYVNYNGRVRTTAAVSWLNMPTWTINQSYYTPEIKTIIQEIVNQGGWASGHDLVIFIRDHETSPSSAGVNRQYASFDHASLSEPRLTVIYQTTDGVIGRADTCDPEVFIVNRHQRAQITHIYNYDDSAVSFSANLLEGAVPWTWFPAATQVNDTIYFGSASGFTDWGPFCNLIVDIVAGSGFNGNWQYWDGVAWSNLALTLQDNTFGLTVGGVNSISWWQPDDWIASYVNFVLGYWVRFLVQGIGAVVRPIQRNRQVYTASIPYVNIPAASVGGDIPALARFKYIDQTANLLLTESLICAIRSNMRGTEFTPYINLGDSQNPSGISINNGFHTTTLLYTKAASGYVANFNPVGAESFVTRITVAFGSTIITQYKGYYRVFLRALQIGGNLGDFNVRLTYDKGGITFYGKTANILSNGQWTVVELGSYDITAIPLAISNTRGTPVDTVSAVDLLGIQASNSNAGAPGDLYLSEVILMPADEWIAQILNNNLYLSGIDHYLDIDSILYPKKRLRVLNRDDTGSIHSQLATVAPGYAIMQANADQRLFFLDQGQRNEDTCILDIEKSQRYFSMRGDR